MSKKRDVGGEVELDMTPMIDCVFLLLIFFMCVTEMQKVEYEHLTLPEASKAIEDVKAATNRVVVNITYSPDFVGNKVHSDIVIKKQKYNEQEKLASYLKLKADQDRPEGAKGSNVTVKIRADQRCEYQKVQRVMVACMKAGISKISIGAEPKH
ncbi:MAG: biopolymer transporter ExbD [Planctomycetota bacterium]|nr:biopolymer transporter ExbD [Planctomycetota bacterium]